jgi:hypothetical protein
MFVILGFVHGFKDQKIMGLFQKMFGIVFGLPCISQHVPTPPAFRTPAGFKLP